MTQMTHTPLSATIARVTALDHYLYTDLGDLEAGWVRADPTRLDDQQYRRVFAVFLKLRPVRLQLPVFE